MCLKLRTPSCNHYFRAVYRSLRSADFPIFRLLSSSVEHWLTANSRSHATILRVFKVHNRQWLIHSSDTSVMGRESEQFPVVNNLFLLISIRTRIPDRTDNCPHTFDLTLTSIPSLCSNISILPPLGSLDHCVTTPSVNYTRHNPSPATC